MNHSPRPDLRRLLADVHTPQGIYAAGLLVEVIQGTRDRYRLHVCLNPPGCHLGACRPAVLPVRCVTRGGKVKPPLTTPKAPRAAQSAHVG